MIQLNGRKPICRTLLGINTVLHVSPVVPQCWPSSNYNDNTITSFFSLHFHHLITPLSSSP